MKSIASPSVPPPEALYETPRLQKLFRKVRANFCFLPCDTKFVRTFAFFPVTRVRNTTEIVQNNLFKSTFILGGESLRVDFPPLIFATSGSLFNLKGHVLEILENMRTPENIKTPRKLPESVGSQSQGTTLPKALRGNLSLRGVRGGLSGGLFEGSAGLYGGPRDPPRAVILSLWPYRTVRNIAYPQGM